MRRRDRIYFGVLAALVVLHAFGVGSAVAFYWYNCKRLSARIDKVQSALEKETRERADALRAVASRVSPPSDFSSDETETETVPKSRVVGYGQTKSKSAHYIYADIEHPDGTMQRHYLRRIPN